ncbi:MAG: MATE family efflux transporter [Pseudomonadota bacterium]
MQSGLENAHAPIEHGSGLSLTGHVRATLRLGLPLAAAQLAQMAIGVADTIMIGWLGAEPLAASVLGIQQYFIFWITATGFAQAIIPLAAPAEARGDITGVRRSTRMGLWVLILCCVLSFVPLWNVEAILILLGQNAESAAMAEDYVRIAMWGLLPGLLFVGLRSFLTAIELAAIVLYASIGGALLNILLNYMFIFGNWGMPRLELEGAAVASLGTNTLMFLIVFGYCLMKAKVRSYDLFARFWRPDWPAFREILQIGWPISAGILAEVGMFISATLIMGWISTVALAAHAIALQIAAVTFMIPLGISNAATARVGHSMGLEDRLALGRAGYAALLIGVVSASIGALIFFTVPEFLVGQFLDNSVPSAAEVLAYATPLLFVAALFQLVDSLQIIGMGVLRGLKDTKIPMIIAVFSFWCLGLPTAYFLGIPMQLGGVGVWTGLAIGLATATVLFCGRFAMRDNLGLVPFGK